MTRPLCPNHHRPMPMRWVEMVDGTEQIALRCTVCDLGDGPVTMPRDEDGVPLPHVACDVVDGDRGRGAWEQAWWRRPIEPYLSSSWLPAGCVAPPPLQVGDVVVDTDSDSGEDPDHADRLLVVHLGRGPGVETLVVRAWGEAYGDEPAEAYGGRITIDPTSGRLVRRNEATARAAWEGL